MEGCRHWQSLSNELSNPKVIRCPRDGNRTQANSFSGTGKARGAAGKTTLFRFAKGQQNQTFSKGTLSYSYFLGKGADESKPNNILAGDRNVLFGKYNNDEDKKAQHIIVQEKVHCQEDSNVD